MQSLGDFWGWVKGDHWTVPVELSTAMQQAVDSGDAALIARYQEEIATLRAQQAQGQNKLPGWVWIVGGFVVWKYVFKGKL